MASRTLRRAGTVVLGLTLTAAVGAGTPALAASPSSVPGRHTPAPTLKQDETKWYQVQYSYQGQPEFLYEIAERFLGDGNRLNEIFELNKGRVQPDGRRMERPESIEPGWYLILPADAKGDGVQTGPLPSYTPATTPAAATPAAPAPAPANPANPANPAPAPANQANPANPAPALANPANPVSAPADETTPANPAASPANPTPTPANPSAVIPLTAADQKDSGSSIPMIVLIVLTLLVVAGVVIGVLFVRGNGNKFRGADKEAPKSSGPLRPRARPAAEPVTKPVAKPVAMPTRNFDTAAAWTIDRALRVLVTNAEAASRAVPSVYGVSLDENRIMLRLAAPDDEMIEPWNAVENGRVWQAALRDLQALPASNDVASPCPRLVTLGTAGGTRELADLGQATGVISIQGNTTAARELVAAWVEELISSPWAGSVRIIATGLHTNLADSDRLSLPESVRDALAAAEDNQTEGSDALRGSHSTQNGTGPGVLFLGSAPGARDMERVQSLVNRPDAAWVVVVLGQTRQDRWRFTIHPDGRLETGALGITVYTGGVSVASGH